MTKDELKDLRWMAKVPDRTVSRWNSLREFYDRPELFEFVYDTIRLVRYEVELLEKLCKTEISPEVETTMRINTFMRRVDSLYLTSLQYCREPTTSRVFYVPLSQKAVRDLVEERYKLCRRVR